MEFCQDMAVIGVGYQSGDPQNAPFVLEASILEGAKIEPSIANKSVPRKPGSHTKLYRSQIPPGVADGNPLAFQARSSLNSPLGQNVWLEAEDPSSLSAKICMDFFIVPEK